MLFREADEVVGFVPLDGLYVGGSSTMVILQVGLDGSWGESEPRVFAYAGLVGYDAAWKSLTAPWSAALQSAGLSHFRMADAMNWRGAFAPKYHEWGEHRAERRTALLNQLVDAMRLAGMKAVGCAAEEGLLGDEKRKALKKREFFEKVIQILLTVVPSEVHLAFICDREQDLAKEVTAWLDREQKQQSAIYLRTAGICYMNSRDVITLQAADLVAYLMRDHGERRLRSEGPNTLLERLTDSSVKTEFILKNEFFS